jgi:hypothetical protein
MIVPSMKPMPEAIIVAASTHGPEVLGQGASPFPDRMTPSSHGGLPTFAISALLSGGAFSNFYRNVHPRKTSPLH